MMVTTTHEDEGEGGPSTAGRPYVMATTTVHTYIRTYVHTDGDDADEDDCVECAASHAVHTDVTPSPRPY